MTERTFLTCTACGSPVPDGAAHCPFCGDAVTHEDLGTGGPIEARPDGVAVKAGGTLRLGRHDGEIRTCAHCGAKVVLDERLTCAHCGTKIVIEALAMPSLVVEKGGQVVIEKGARLVIGGGSEPKPKAPRRGAVLSFGPPMLDEKLVAALVRGERPKAEKRVYEGHEPIGHDIKGRTLIEIVLEEKKPELVAWLLERGADLEERDRRGDTALIAAVRRKDAVAVTTLLAHGARWDATDKKGQTALDVAERIADARLTEPLRAARRAAR